MTQNACDKTYTLPKTINCLEYTKKEPRMSYSTRNKQRNGKKIKHIEILREDLQQ